jgi:transmembrane sensor
MKGRMDNGSKQQIAAIAAQWFVRRQSGTWDATQEQTLAAWLAAAPEHAREFQTLQALWSELDQVKGTLPSVAQPHRSARRTGWRLVACSAVLVLMVLGGMAYYRTTVPVYQHTLTTTARQRLDATLPDGSILALNVNSQAVVVYFRSRRTVSLVHGEAFFTVAPDTTRPFLVRVKDLTIRVLGTQFNVYLAPAAVCISVVHGRVAVHSSATTVDNGLILASGQGAEFAATVTCYAVQAEEVASWRLGHVVFRNQPLAAVLHEVGRYRRLPIVLDNVRLGERRLSGVLNTNNPDVFLDALPQILPVAVQRQPDGTVVITRKP